MSELASGAGSALDQAGEVGRALRAPQQRASARKLVLVATGGLLAINVYRADREQGSLYRRLWGTGVLGVMLSVAADFAPELAGPFALLVLLGSLTNGGDRVLQNVLGTVARSPSVAPAAPVEVPPHGGNTAQTPTGSGAITPSAPPSAAAGHTFLTGGL